MFFLLRWDMVLLRWDNFQPKSSIPIGGKVEISPKGFTLGVKVKPKKIFSICLKLLINATFYV
jgi:hypothetical protein